MRPPNRGRAFPRKRRMPIVQNKKPAKRQLTAEDILVAGLDALGEGFAVFDSSRAFVCCNRPFVALTGYPVGLCQPGDPLASFLRFDAERDEPQGLLLRAKRK